MVGCVGGLLLDSSGPRLEPVSKKQFVPSAAPAAACSPCISSAAAALAADAERERGRVGAVRKVGVFRCEESSACRREWNPRKNRE